MVVNKKLRYTLYILSETLLSARNFFHVVNIKKGKKEIKKIMRKALTLMNETIIDNMTLLF